MKAKSILIITLSLIITGFSCLFSQNGNSTITADLPVNSKQSKNLIDRFNALRASDNLQSIKHDSVLDNISKKLLTDKTYRKSKKSRKTAGVFDEDSVRLLLYKSGIIDYQYEVQEILDKDTANVFNSFLLADNSNYIRAGYYKNENKHILFKTKSYLKYTHGTMKNWCDPIKIPMGVPIDPMNPPSAKCYVDSIVNYFKVLIPDQYYYQFYEKIPLSSEKGGNIKKKKVQITRGVSMYGEYDFTTIALGQKAYMFLIISNKNNERVVIIR